MVICYSSNRKLLHLPSPLTSAGSCVLGWFRGDPRGGTKTIREVGMVTLRRLIAVYQLACSIFVFSQVVQLPWSGWAACQPYLCVREYQCMGNWVTSKMDSFSGWMSKKKTIEGH